MRFEVRPIRVEFGAELEGFDVRDLDEQDVRKLVDVLADRGVVVARNQRLAPDEFVALMRRLGPLEYSVRDEFHLPENPDVYVISNIMENGKYIGNPFDGFGWHTDMNFCERPTAYTALYGLEVPEEGADTRFCSAFRAYDLLPAERQAFLRGIQVRHSHDMLHATRRNAPPLTAEQRARAPDVVHPLVRTHPHSGRRCVYLGPKCAVPLGMAEEEGIRLLDELLALATDPGHVYSHRWRVRDLVIWDNRGMLHCATEYDRQKYRRLLHRVTVGGERPF